MLYILQSLFACNYFTTTSHNLSYSIMLFYNSFTHDEAKV